MTRPSVIPPQASSPKSSLGTQQSISLHLIPAERHIDSRITPSSKEVNVTVGIKAVLFDFMGTCLEWHSSVLSAFPPDISKEEASSLALRWRQKYFDLNSARVNGNEPVEPFDTTLAHALDLVVSEECAHLSAHFTAEARKKAVGAFHVQDAWPDVKPALVALRHQDLENFVHANGSTRLQLDLVQSSQLWPWIDMLFSSQLLGVYMPAPEAYEKVLELIDAKPHEVVKVAAHAWDPRGAKEVGIRTVYVRRRTDDVEEDMEVLKEEFDVFLEGMEELPDVVKNFNQ